MTSWPLAQLGEVVCRPSTWNPATNTPNGSFVYVDLSAVNQETKQIVGARHMACKDAPSRARQLVAAGDVLVSTVRPNLNNVARVQPELDGVTASTGFCVLRPRDGLLDPDYLFHWVRTSQFVASMTERASGASYPAVSDRIVLDSSIPLPPLAEQRRIAEILDRADALWAQRRAALTSLKHLHQAAFLDICGDPATNPRGWPVMPLAALASKFSDGPFGLNLKTSHYSSSGVRVIRLQNIGSGEFLDQDRAFITRDHFDRLAKHECLSGDVLVGTMGNPNLRACIQPAWLDLALNKADCVQIRPKRDMADSEYLCALLNQPATERMAQDLIVGQTRLRISMGRLRTLDVPVPH